MRVSFYSDGDVSMTVYHIILSVVCQCQLMILMIYKSESVMNSENIDQLVLVDQH